MLPRGGSARHRDGTRFR